MSHIFCFLFFCFLFFCFLIFLVRTFFLNLFSAAQRKAFVITALLEREPEVTLQVKERTPNSRWQTWPMPPAIKFLSCEQILPKRKKNHPPRPKGTSFQCTLRNDGFMLNWLTFIVRHFVVFLFYECTNKTKTKQNTYISYIKIK